MKKNFFGEFYQINGVESSPNIGSIKLRTNLKHKVYVTNVALLIRYITSFENKQQKAQNSRTATTSKVVKVFTKRHRARHKIIPSKWRHENGAKIFLIYGLYFASNTKCQFCLDICLLSSPIYTYFDQF